MSSASAAAANAAAIALRNEGRRDEAIATLREGASAFPEALPLRQNLAQLLYEAGDVPGAIAEHRAVITRDIRNVASNLALYELLQIAGDPTMAVAHQRLALEEQRVFGRIAPHQTRSVLVLLAPGDWQANIPVDFLFDPDTTTVYKRYLLGEAYLPLDKIPEYDVLWNAIAESREALPFLALAERVMREARKPTLNDPKGVMSIARERLRETLEGTGCVVPELREVTASELGGSAGLAFPIIARPVGSHAGHGLEKLERAEQCAAYVARNPAPSYFVSPFVDYANADGYFRKYRIVFVDGQAYPVHLAISPNWMIHYYNAPMAENAWMREEEAAFLRDLRSAFDAKTAGQLEQLARAVGLDYFGIDASIDRDGNVLVFEADPAMLVHTTDPIELYPYKHEYIPRIYRAVERLIDARRADR